MKLYLTPLWIPFPGSEYGGMTVIKAKNRKEVEELLISTVDEYTATWYPDYRPLIATAARRATEIDLLELSTVETPEILGEFRT